MSVLLTAWLKLFACINDYFSAKLSNFCFIRIKCFTFERNVADSLEHFQTHSLDFFIHVNDHNAENIVFSGIESL